MADDEHLCEERVRAAGRNVGLKSVRQIEQAVGGLKNHLQRYMEGEGNPGSDALLRMSELLKASPSYLYGRPMDDVRKNLVAMVRTVFGIQEASALEIVAELPQGQKAAAVKILDALSHAEIPPSAFERDFNVSDAKSARPSAGSKKK